MALGRLRTKSASSNSTKHMVMTPGCKESEDILLVNGDDNSIVDGNDNEPIVLKRGFIVTAPAKDGAAASSTRSKYNNTVRVRSLSLGSGEFSKDGTVSFSPTITNRSILSSTNGLSTNGKNSKSKGIIHPEDPSLPSTPTSNHKSPNKSNNTRSSSSKKKQLVKKLPKIFSTKKFKSKTSSSNMKVLKSEDSDRVVENGSTFDVDDESRSHQQTNKHTANRDRANTGGSQFSRQQSSFIRVADLGLDLNKSYHDLADSDIIHPHFHHASNEAPPGEEHDPNEHWVALDDGFGSHSPVAPTAIQALAKSGLTSSYDESMWSPESKTNKILTNSKKKGDDAGWHTIIWEDHGSLVLPETGVMSDESEVLIWSGSFKHTYYGHELPAIRAMGIIQMSPKSLFDLLVDSTRVKEYNKMSLGRDDLLVLQNSITEDGPFGFKSITKVMKSTSQPPMVRKTLQFVSLLHAIELDNDDGYLIVTRAVNKVEDGEEPSDNANVLRSEILLGVNVIRPIANDSERCLMINVNHIRSPMVPQMIAKRLGLTAAVNFINDIRALC